METLSCSGVVGALELFDLSGVIDQLNGVSTIDCGLSLHDKHSMDANNSGKALLIMMITPSSLLCVSILNVDVSFLSRQSGD